MITHVHRITVAAFLSAALLFVLAALVGVAIARPAHDTGLTPTGEPQIPPMPPPASQPTPRTSSLLAPNGNDSTVWPVQTRRSNTPTGTVVYSERLVPAAPTHVFPTQLPGLRS